MMELEEYLTMNVVWRRDPAHKWGTLKEYQYCCMEELVLKEGIYFKGSPLPAVFKKMPDKMCFQNAFELMLSDGLIYCEGYATSVIPVHHAWLVDSKGNVVDPTWKEPEKCEYWGIPFKRDFVMKTICKNKVYGIIDDWKNHWPLCKNFDPNIKEVIG